MPTKIVRKVGSLAIQADDVDWDDEQETWPVECILDTRAATEDDLKANPEWRNGDVDVKVGDKLYLVAWEGWDPSYNSWEPYAHIADDDLIVEYEIRAEAAEDEAVDVAVEVAEEAAAHRIAASAVVSVEAEADVSQGGPAPMIAELPSNAHAQQLVEQMATFKTEIASCLPRRVVDAMVELASEQERAAAYAGGVDVPLAELLKRWDLMATWVETTNGELLGFALTHEEGRAASAKMFVWHLHVKAESRRKGIATALMNLVQMKSSLSSVRRQGGVLMELRVHATNVGALAFYNHYGFVQKPASATSGDAQDVLTMCRKR